MAEGAPGTRCNTCADGGVLPGVPLGDGAVMLRPWRVEEADWYVEQTADPEIRRFTTEPPALDPAVVRARSR